MRSFAVSFCALLACACTAQLSSLMDPSRATTMPMALLQNAAVQQELQLTGQQKSAIKKAVDELNLASRNQGANLGQLSTALTEANQKVLAVLDENQRARFHQVRYQVLGMRSLGELEVQTALALTEEQKDAVKAFEKDEMAGMMREAQKGPSAMGKWQKEKGKREAELGKILTPEQVEKLTALKGKPFKDADKIAGR